MSTVVYIVLWSCSVVYMFQMTRITDILSIFRQLTNPEDSFEDIPKSGEDRMKGLSVNFALYQ